MNAEYAIWLYGSHARGNADPYSDLDIFVAADDEIDIECLRHRTSLTITNASISRYTWGDISRMVQYGSLFLQHLKTEAVPLYETPFRQGALREMLDQMGDYSFASKDIQGFQVVLDDIEEGLEDGDKSIYELAVLGTVIRHASILGCWLLRRASFGRYDAVSKFAALRGIKNLAQGEFSNLYDYRLYANGRIAKESLRMVSEIQWLDRARVIVASVEELVHERN